ncbi:rRNA processing protein Bystin, putative [Talaromyces stipitatus ATCC 10500]|uniref:rRNA processing protein Bystin, putative n=1 Tax=Talaromyces stipitatus (strain ATCC 10500 / CBS 375.48 / QM 6759 / NRRL 1006) TaxID=441959 RepID=B8MNW7_TALSN|nr:rRNA processing protein Bystin, putative [Talaromyces stipitatus ATCC 10500]EED14206.1 rRNA processing protein Bystin, putative [Talaromyces stipitatus ATCC 10500]
MPKATTPSRSTARRHNPLAEDILSNGHLRTTSKSGKKRSRKNDDDDDAENGGRSIGEGYIDAKASRKILQIGQDLAEEEAAEQQKLLDETGAGQQHNKAFDFSARFGDENDYISEDEEKFEEEDWEDEDLDKGEVDPNDLDMFNKFIPAGDQDPIFDPRPNEEGEEGSGVNLADLILQKIAAYEANQSSDGQQVIKGGGAPEDAVQIPAKALEVYEKVGMILSRYKSGPLPKPFKILPTLPQWPTLLDITRPDSWTPNAVYAGTRIFISSKPAIAQQFINMVLLERVRDEIHETRKLNVHVYNALKKALYKPACFFKGLLFPLIASGICTLREAHIVSSVIARVSIPVLHSAAALLRLCEIAAEQTSASLSSEGTGATNIFIRVFLEKKYALPYKVIDALVFHFLRFRAMDNTENDHMMIDGAHNSAAASMNYKLPVLWHQSLLVFAQRYRNDITEDQREALLDLLLVRGHKDIGPEVRRELLAGRGRGVVVPSADSVAAAAAGDDTMDVEM